MIFIKVGMTICKPLLAITKEDPQGWPDIPDPHEDWLPACGLYHACFM